MRTLRRPIIKVDKCTIADDGAAGGLENARPTSFNFINYTCIIISVAVAKKFIRRTGADQILSNNSYSRFVSTKCSTKVRTIGSFATRIYTSPFYNTTRPPSRMRKRRADASTNHKRRQVYTSRLRHNHDNRCHTHHQQLKFTFPRFYVTCLS